MRFTILPLFLLVLFTYCSNTEDKNVVNSDLIMNPITADGNSDTTILPRISFKEEFFDFGVVIQGEKVSHTFTFTNTGKSALIISSVHAGCGCTVPKYSKDPIAPGASGEIEVTFDSSGRSGVQSKSVTVSSNAQPSGVELRFIADVAVPK
jgi:hypothetical protein